MLIEGVNFRELAEVPSDLLTPVIDGCNTFDWTPERLNQPATSGALMGGKTLEFPFIIQHPATRFRPYTAPEIDLLNLAIPVFSWIQDFLGTPIVLIRCEYSTLLPKSRIKWHIDANHNFFKYCQRIHIPVTSNEGCEQMWERERTRFLPGKIYEYNNLVRHCAANEGDAPRTTLILDIVKESEWETLASQNVFNRFAKPKGNIRTFTS